MLIGKMNDIHEDTIKIYNRHSGGQHIAHVQFKYKSETPDSSWPMDLNVQQIDDLIGLLHMVKDKIEEKEVIDTVRNYEISEKMFQKVIDKYDERCDVVNKGGNIYRYCLIKTDHVNMYIVKNIRENRYYYQLSDQMNHMIFETENWITAMQKYFMEHF